MPTSNPMQLGMVGLGRMGAGLVGRLMRDGHHCVVYDVNPAAVTALEKDGALTGSAVLKRSSESGSHNLRRSGKKSGRPSGYKDDPYH